MLYSASEPFQREWQGPPLGHKPVRVAERNENRKSGLGAAHVCSPPPPLHPGQRLVSFRLLGQSNWAHKSPQSSKNVLCPSHMKRLATELDHRSVLLRLLACWDLTTELSLVCQRQNLLLPPGTRCSRKAKEIANPAPIMA